MLTVISGTTGVCGGMEGTLCVSQLESLEGAMESTVQTSDPTPAPQTNTGTPTVTMNMLAPEVTG